MFIQAWLIWFFVMLDIGRIIVVAAITNIKLAILLPTTAPTAKSAWLFTTALILLANSGNEVPPATITTPMANNEIFNFFPKLSYAKIADACGFKGIRVNTQEELTEALKLSCKEQMEGTTTFIEVMLNQELGEPFRRDAMKAPVEVAGIDPKDTVIQ